MERFAVSSKVIDRHRVILAGLLGRNRELRASWSGPRLYYMSAALLRF
jgi:hypothetical protein